MMKLRAFLVGAVAATAAASLSPANASPRTIQSPFACDRMALTPALRHRHFDELGPFLRTKVMAARADAEGYSFEFPNDWKTYASLVEWMNGERVCCPFFDFNLRTDREHGQVWLRLSGRPGTKQFIQSDFAPWLAKARLVK